MNFEIAVSLYFNSNIVKSQLRLYYEIHGFSKGIFKSTHKLFELLNCPIIAHEIGVVLEN